MIHLNPALNYTLRSTGARGCQFWLRQHDEDYYQGVKNLKTIDGVVVGEWRGGNCQSIIFGRHPNHTEEKPVLYRSNGKAVSRLLRFKDIVWPESVKHVWTPKTPRSSSNQSNNGDQDTGDEVTAELSKRVSAYMLKVPPSIEGSSGDTQLFIAASALIFGWGLSQEQALPFLEAYNERSEPPWELERLLYKLSEADKNKPREGRGHLRSAESDLKREAFTAWIVRFKLGGTSDAQRKDELSLIGLEGSSLEMVVDVLKTSNLSKLQRYQVIQLVYKVLGVKSSDLEEVCTPDSGGNVPEKYADPESWTDVVDGASLLNELTALIRKHICLKENEAYAIALWILLTYSEPNLDIAPLLSITSPQKRCGKTNLLKLLQLLVKRALKADCISVSALFRTIEKWCPTCLIDEADTFIKENEEMRGLINSGYERGGVFIRCNAVTLEPEEFSTWSFKAIASIGKLPDTIQDRSIPIALERRSQNVPVTKLRDADLEQIARLKRQLFRWALDNGERVQSTRPTIPEVLNDRAGDCWYPMFSVADVAGGDWSKRARSASVELSTSEEDDNFSIALLLGLREIVNKANTNKDGERLPEESLTRFFSTAELVSKLNLDKEAPWADWGSGDQKGITAHKMGRELKKYGVRSKQSPEREDRHRGFYLDDLEHVFAQYLCSRPPFVENRGQSVHQTR